MKITNNGNLPEPLYQAIVAQQQQHSVGEADISCTGLIDAPLIAWLRRNYREQVVEDAEAGGGDFHSVMGVGSG